MVDALHQQFESEFPAPGTPEATLEYRPEIVSSLGFEPHAGHMDTSWDDPSWPTVDGVRYSLWCLSADPGGPVVLLVDSPPGTPPVPTWRFATDHLRVVVAGSCKIGDRWYCAGDVRVQNADEPYGPETTGSEGSRQVIVFARRDRCVPLYADVTDARTSTPAVELILQTSPR
jgi:hypothetical protein